MTNTKSDTHEWRYTSDRAIARHAVDRLGLHLSFYAVCGVHPSLFGDGQWYGTGTQAEYDKNAQLPQCKHCLRMCGLLNEP